jgi:hypothetical protein
MSCQDYREQIHGFVDRELAACERTAVANHLRFCPDCQAVVEELHLLKQALSEPVPFSEESQQRAWQSLVGQTRRSWRTGLRDWMDLSRARWRDLDLRPVWAKLAAAPVTFVLFSSLLVLFPGIQIQEWTYSAFMVAPPISQEMPSLPVTIHAVQSRREINELIETIWRIPYEDSLSFVAEIQPEGHAEIGNVLEYPRNPDLLEAFDMNLRNTQFERVVNDPTSFLIYSFQKVDVYEGQGL